MPIARPVRFETLEHFVTGEATLPPADATGEGGGAIELRFQPSHEGPSGSGRVFVQLSVVPSLPGESAASTVLEDSSLLAGNATAGVLFAPPRPIPKPTLGLSVGELVVVEPDLPPPPPAPVPARIEVGPEGGPFQTMDITLTQNMPFTVTGVPLPDQPEVVALAAAPAALPLGPFGSPPPTWVARITNLGTKKIRCRARVFFPVRRKVVVTRIPLADLGRVFGGALHWLTPSIRVSRGDLVVSLPVEATESLGVPPTRVPLDGADLSAATVSIEPVRFDFIRVESFLRRAFTELREHLQRRLAQLNRRLTIGQAFVERMVEEALRGNGRNLPAFAVGLLRPTGLTVKVIEKAFEDLDIPTGLMTRRAGRPLNDALAMRVALELRDLAIAGEAMRIDAKISVKSILATLYVLVNATSRETFLTRFTVAVKKFRIEDVELGGSDLLLPVTEAAERIVTFIGNRFTSLFERKFERVAEKAVRDFLQDNRTRLARHTLDTLLQIAERDHELFEVLRDRTHLVIEHLEPLEHRPTPRPQPRAEPLGIPIDGPMPTDAEQRLAAIEHIVVVSMENRSFDHMLGYLSHRESTPRRSDIDGLTGNEEIPLGGNVTGSPARPLPNPQVQFRPDPDHSFDGISLQIGSDGAMEGFIPSFREILARAQEIQKPGFLADESRIVGFHTAATLPLYDYLAREHCVLDRWFASLPGATYPNRMCLKAGTTRSRTNSGLIPDLGYLSERTVFDELDLARIPWRYYEGDVTFLRAFDGFRIDFNRIRPLREFLEGGSAPLAPVTFIDPPFTGAPGSSRPADDHPPTDVAWGQWFIGEVLRRVMSSTSWRRTLLIITYDEHGGFYDHVPPPGTARFRALNPDVSDDIPKVHSDASSWGVRVPALAVSPRLPRGSVGRRIYDHTTIIRTILQRFAPDRIPFMPERVRRARHLGELLLAEPRAGIAAPPRIDPPLDLGVEQTNSQSGWDLTKTGRDPSRDDRLELLRLLGTPLR
jgi:phospholipase C